MPLITEVRTEAEIEQVRSLLRAYRSELPPQVPLPRYDEEVQGLPGQYAAPRGCMLLASVSGQPAGCVCLRPMGDEGACEMKRLYVLPAFRGDSLGRQLIEQIINEARSRQYARMRLDTNPPSMQSAVALYRRFGFVQLSNVKDPVPGFLYMELEL
jgi:ribosomal protein S18 acetylase RimI-like enzyme